MRRFSSIIATVLILMPVSVVSQQAFASVQVGESSDRTMTVASEGMAPTLHRGDHVQVSTRARCCRRGDVVVFLTGPSPGWRGSGAPNNVKRVIALPGETISLCETGAVCIDGEPLRERYLARHTVTTMNPSLPYITDANDERI